MTQRFYKNEYTPMQWALLIDEATTIGCGVEYNKYGEICTIDSTDVESRLIYNSGRGEQDRLFWAEHIFNTIHEAAMKMRPVWSK